MKALGSTESRCMRVLSPRTEPPVRTEDGSTASTPTLRPLAVSRLPSASMKVDLPTPGTPEIPTRTVSPAGSLVSSSRAMSRCWGLVDSTNVIARDTAARLPSLMPSRRSCTSGPGMASTLANREPGQRARCSTSRTTPGS